MLIAMKSAQTIDRKDSRMLGWYATRWAMVLDVYNNRKSAGRSRVNPLASKNKKEGKTDQQKLEQAVKESSECLIEVKTVFPFTLFPNTISIDRHKLTLTYRSFFNSEESVSVPIPNLKNIQASLDMFFGSLVITSDHFANNTQEIKFLKRDDAKEIQRLVQGAMVANAEKIDVSKVEVPKLKQLLHELGSANSV
jgi:hypothetical protein